MEKIVDIHMHVLHGIDDGAKNMEESIVMLQQSAAQGVGTIVVTPHSWAIDSRGIDLVHSRFSELKQTTEEKQIPVDLFLGCEMLVYPDTVDDCIQKLKDGRYPTMAGSNYVLTEFEPYFPSTIWSFVSKRFRQPDTCRSSRMRNGTNTRPSAA